MLIYRKMAAWGVSLAVLCSLTLLFSGCGTQEGETVMTAGPNSPDNVGKAPYTGTYLLYTAASPNPTLTQNLKEGDTLGFRKTTEGQIEVLYGDKSYTLPKGTMQVYLAVPEASSALGGSAVARFTTAGAAAKIIIEAKNSLFFIRFLVCSSVIST